MGLETFEQTNKCGLVCKRWNTVVAPWGAEGLVPPFLVRINFLIC